MEVTIKGAPEEIAALVVAIQRRRIDLGDVEIKLEGRKLEIPIHGKSQEGEGDTKFTDFGKEIKKRLIDIDKTQNWLIEQVRNKTGQYFDDSYLYKIMVGKRPAPVIVQTIREILDFSKPENGGS